MIISSPLNIELKMNVINRPKNKADLNWMSLQNKNIMYLRNDRTVLMCKSEDIQWNLEVWMYKLLVFITIIIFIIIFSAFQVKFEHDSLLQSFQTFAK